MKKNTVRFYARSFAKIRDCVYGKPENLRAPNYAGSRYQKLTARQFKIAGMPVGARQPEADGGPAEGQHWGAAVRPGQTGRAGGQVHDLWQREH